MKHFLIVVLFLFIAFFSNAQKAIVTAVHDGDSYGVRFLNRPDTTIWIRLHNVDCPEVIFYVTKDQPFGREAGKLMREFLKGDTVDVKFIYFDTFKRPVCDVYKDTINLTDYVLTNGYGWFLVDSATTLERENEIKEMQMYAQNKKLGLWGLKGRKVRPETWRRKYSRIQ